MSGRFLVYFENTTTVEMICLAVTYVGERFIGVRRKHDFYTLRQD